MVGEGCGIELLCRMTASACGCEVYAGPEDAAAYGNAAIQLISLGEIGSHERAAEMISASCGIKVYPPEDRDEWEKAYARFTEIMGK